MCAPVVRKLVLQVFWTVSIGCFGVRKIKRPNHQNRQIFAPPCIPPKNNTILKRLIKCLINLYEHLRRRSD